MTSPFENVPCVTASAPAAGLETLAPSCSPQEADASQLPTSVVKKDPAAVGRSTRETKLSPATRVKRKHQASAAKLVNGTASGELVTPQKTSTLHEGMEPAEALDPPAFPQLRTRAKVDYNEDSGSEPDSPHK